MGDKERKTQRPKKKVPILRLTKKIWVDSYIAVEINVCERLVFALKEASKNGTLVA